MKKCLLLSTLLLCCAWHSASAQIKAPTNLLTPVGPIGIGTLDPQQSLDIKSGTIRLQAYGSSPLGDVQTATSGRVLVVNGLGDIVAGPPCTTCVGVPVPALGYWSLTGNDDLDGTTNFLGTKGNVNIQVRTNNIARMTIGAGSNAAVNFAVPIVAGKATLSDQLSGNSATFSNDVIVSRLGINTNQFGECKLAVEGIIGARGLKILPNGALFPDYVFEKEYPLLSFKELEDYVTSNKHLPGIPSAAEVAKNEGVEVGEMNRLLLEKVEEQTLYILQLKKQLDELQVKVSQLK